MIEPPDTTDELAKIGALEAELAELERVRRMLEGSAPPGGCGSPLHAAAPARIAELEAELARRQPSATAKLTGFLARLGRNRAQRLQTEIARLVGAVSEARKRAHGDPALLAELKELRRQRDAIQLEVRGERVRDRDAQ